MHVTCPACGESFDLDDGRAREVRVARCICGANIDLHSISSHQQFGKYFLQERIAAGGMGEVFRAKIAGVEGFERPVAIKKMLPHLSADRDFIAMLIKEAKLSVLLHHPNIVQVYDLAKEGNEYYIAMEYVPSVNLSTLLEHCATSGRFLPVAVAVSVALQTLQGLGYAHTLKGADGEPMNILHRDITPQNILITKDGWVKITDFGIAKAKNEISTTRPGTIRGKLGYVAPEQLKTKDADQRVDIFCAGVVLWESLATRRLFKGDDEIDTLRLIVETRVPALTGVRDDVTPELDAAVRKAVAREPNNRYPTAAAFHDALLAAIAPVSADLFLKQTRTFLAEVDSLFHRETNDASPDNPTVALGTTADTTAPKTRSVTITDLVAKPPQLKRRLLLLAVSLLFLSGAAFGYYKWRWSPRVPSAPPLSTDEVQAAVDGTRSRLMECYQNHPGHEESVQARITVASDGVITNVEISPPSLGNVTTCLSSVIRTIRMRTHAEPTFHATVELPPPPEATPKPDVPKDQPNPSGAQDTPRPADNPARPTRPLSVEEIQRTVVAHFAPVARCLAQLKPGSAPETVNARLVIRPNGRVSEVELSPNLDSPAATRCLNNTLRNLRFGQGTKAVEVNLPLHLQSYTTGK